jgi:nucleotide-binding universal stress UspA family protein
MLAIKTILHPTDFSTGSELAFRLACALAQDYGAPLVVAHVVEVPVTVYGEGVLMLPPQVNDGALRDKLNEIKPRQVNVCVDHYLAHGDPASEILRLAQDAKADVIVMGTHGRTGLPRLLMGSVAEQVVRKAPCPVVTVKSPMSSRQVSVKAVPEPVGHMAEVLSG